MHERLKYKPMKKSSEDQLVWTSRAIPKASVLLNAWPVDEQTPLVANTGDDPSQSIDFQYSPYIQEHT